MRTLTQGAGVAALPYQNYPAVPWSYSFGLSFALFLLVPAAGGSQLPLPAEGSGVLGFEPGPDIIAGPESPHCSGTHAYCLFNLCSLFPGHAFQKVIIMLQADGLLGSQGGMITDVF